MGDFTLRPFTADPQSVVQLNFSALLSIYIYIIKNASQRLLEQKMANLKPLFVGKARHENVQIQAEINRYICAVSAV